MPKELYDGAMPSGNSVAALNLLRLSRLSGDTQLEARFEKMIDTFSGEINHYPNGFSHFLMAILFAFGGSKEIVIVGDRNQSKTNEMIQILQSQFLPQIVLLLKENEDTSLKQLAPFIQEYQSIQGETTVYICEDHSCQAPTTDVKKLMNM